MIIIKVKLDGDLIRGKPERNTNNTTLSIANRKQELNSMNIHEFFSWKLRTQKCQILNKQWLHIKFCVHYSFFFLIHLNTLSLWHSIYSLKWTTTWNCFHSIQIELSSSLIVVNSNVTITSYTMLWLIQHSIVILKYSSAFSVITKSRTIHLKLDYGILVFLFRFRFSILD